MIEATAPRPEQVASHYDDLDEFYREVWGLHVHHGLWETGRETPEVAAENLLRRVFRDVALEGARVCDIGCGYGGTARYLARERGASVEGYTVSSAQLRVAESLAGTDRERLRFHCRDWMENGAEPGSFDVAISIESSEHMPDLRKFFEEARRVLKPGGKLRICAWLARENLKAWERTRLLEPICKEGQLRLGTQREYETLLRETGFEGVAYEDLTEQVKRTWTICLRRVLAKTLTDSRYARFLLTDPSRNKEFLYSLLRIRLAYETRSMSYGIFSASRG